MTQGRLRYQLREIIRSNAVHCDTGSNKYSFSPFFSTSEDAGRPESEARFWVLLFLLQVRNTLG